MSFLSHLYLNAMAHPYDTLWTAIGFGGQGVFGIRFLIQWLSSEKAGHSVIPIAFWYCSLVGGVTLLLYAIHLDAWPLVMGQAMPLPIYVRNLWMIYRDRARAAQSAA
jgi:lipid-A-disaccharide synthase-like uncharacterized protein